jgi:hypothetical protein
MAHDNPLFKPRKTAPESVFVKGNEEILVNRIQELTHSLETTRSIIFIPKPVAELKESAAGQASKVFQHGAPIQLPPEITNAPDLVAYAKQAEADAATAVARQVVEQAFDGGAVEAVAEAETLPSNVILPVRPEVEAGRQAVIDAQQDEDEETRHYREVA